MSSLMETAETSRYFDPYVQTHSIDESALAERAFSQREWAIGWRHLVEKRLADLVRKRSATIDQITYPTNSAIRLAHVLVPRLMSLIPPPDRVVPNGDGGIVMEFDNGFHLVELEIESDGSVRIRQFSGLDLTSENQIPSPFPSAKQPMV